MPNLTADCVRRLDALNLVEATARGDRETAINIMVMYNEAQLDNPRAFADLAHSLAFIAAMLYRQKPDNPSEWVAMVRQSMLNSEETGP